MSRPGAGSSSGAADGKGSLAEDLVQGGAAEAYEHEIPPWRPRLHPGSASLGYPDIFPPEPDRPNDITEQTLRAGITSRPVVGNETFSAHDMIYDRLRSGQALESLGTFLEEMMQRREEIQRFRIGPHLHKAPPRVTLTELKLNAYVKDLADPSVPLARLARSVPHGYRGERLLEMLWQGGPVPLATAPNAAQAAKPPAGPGKPVTLPRAMWFIRTVGCGEISSARNRNTASYTAEWTTALCNWLRKQLAELNVGTGGGGGVSSAAPGSPATPLGRSTGGQSKGGSASTPGAVPAEPPVLASEEARKRWGLKWAWSLRLVRHMTTQSLLDMRLLSRWVVDVLSSASLTQLPTTLALAHEFSPYILEDHRVLRSLAEALCSKLTEMGKLPTSKPVRRIAAQLVALLQYAFEVAPDAFVSSSLWSAHGVALKEALLSTAPFAEGSKRAEQRAFDVAQLEARNRRLICLGADEEGEEVPLQVRKVKALDEIGLSTSTSAALDIYLRASKSSPTGFSDSVDDILLWGSTRWRSGRHRPFAAAHLLSLLVKALSRYASAAHRVGAKPVDHDLDAAVFRWLGSVEEAQACTALGNAEGGPPAGPSDEMRTHVLASVNFHEVLVLLGELIRFGTLSFPKFLQRLTARGLTATTSQRLAGTNGFKGPVATDGLRSKVLRSIPLYSNASGSAGAAGSGSGANTLLGQRRIAIYGHRQKESYEEATARRAVRELRQHLGFLYPTDEGEEEEGARDGTGDPGLRSEADIAKRLPHFWMGSRYVRLSIVESEILPRAKAVGLKLGAARLAIVVHLIAGVEDFASLAEILLSLTSGLVRDSTDYGLYELVHASITRFISVWRSMGLANIFSERLMALQATSERRGRADEAEVSKRTILAWQSHDEATLTSKDFNEPPKSAEDKPVATPDQAAALPPELNGHANGTAPSKDAPPVVGLLLEALAKTTSALTEVDVDAFALSVRTACTTERDAMALERSFKEWACSWLTTEGPQTDAVSAASAQENLCRLVLSLILRRVLDLATVLDSLILASARQAAKEAVTSSSSDRSEPPLWRNLALGVKLARLLFAPSDLPTETPLLDGQLLDATCSTALSKRHCQVNVVELLTLWTVCLQCGAKPEASVAADIRQALASLSSDVRIRSLATLRYGETCARIKATCRAMWGIDADAVLSSLLVALNPETILGASAVDVDCTVIRRHLNPWQAQTTTTELAVIVERLNAVESGLQARAHLVLANLARSALAPLFLENKATYGKALLAKLHGQEFASRIVDCAFERLAPTLKTGSSEESKSQDVVRALIAIADGGRRGQLPSASVEPVATLCNAVIQGLEALLAQWQRAASRSSGLAAMDEVLDVDLLERILQSHSLLLRTSGLWTTLPRPTAAKLLSHVAELALRVAQAPDERSGQLLDLLLDLSAAAMDDAPSETVSLVVGVVNKALGSSDGVAWDGTLSANASASGLEIPTDTVSRLRRIFGAGPAQQRSSRVEDLILARSARAAIEHCAYQAAPDKPWELQDSTEASLSGVQTQLGPNSAVAKEAAAKEARLGYAQTPIQDVGSLSLSLFGVVKTFDRVPIGSVDAAPNTRTQERLMGWKKHESERSYGLGVGGEPIYSRDARKLRTAPPSAGGEPKRTALPLALQKADEILERAKRREEEEREEAERRKAAQAAAKAAAQVAAAAAAAAAAPKSSGAKGKPGAPEAAGGKTTSTAAGKKRKASTDVAPSATSSSTADKRKKGASGATAAGKKAGGARK